MEMVFWRSEPPKVWEHLLLPLPLSLLWARTSHRVGRAFLKLQDHPAFNEGQAVPGLVMRTLVCPRAQQPPSLQAPSHPSVAPPGSHQLSRSFLLQPLECQHHTRTPLAAQVSWMPSLGAVAPKTGSLLAALHTGGHFRRHRVLVASAPAVFWLWHSSQGFTQPTGAWAAAQPPQPV